MALFQENEYQFKPSLRNCMETSQYVRVRSALSYYDECFSFHQWTPLDVAVERGYVDIAEFFLGGGMSEVSVGDSTAGSILLVVY